MTNDDVSRDNDRSLSVASAVFDNKVTDISRRETVDLFSSWTLNVQKIL